MKIIQLDGLYERTTYLLPQGSWVSSIRDKWGNIIGFQLSPATGVVLDSSGKIDNGNRPVFTHVGEVVVSPFTSNTTLKGLLWNSPPIN